MNIEIKICGLSDADCIEVAIEGGASHIGFIFFEKSPRHVSLELASRLALPIKGRAYSVAVSVNADDNYLDAITNAMAPDLLQLHGSETPDRIRAIKARYGLPVMKAFAVNDAKDFGAAKKYFGIADRLLFDAKPPKGSDLPGGNGVSFDWRLFADWQNEHYGPMPSMPSDIPLDSPHPPMLSGGLNGDNIARALKQSNARAVDISSGVEKHPGSKDPLLIKGLMRQIREQECGRNTGE